MVYVAPTLLDGMSVPAALLQAALDEIAHLSAQLSNNQLFVRKTLVESVISTTTLQNDDELLVPVAASSVYQFTLSANILSGATPDFKLGWSLPAGATMTWSVQEGTPGNLAAVLQGPFTAASVVAINGTGTDQMVIAEGLVIVSTTPGTMRLQWAQNTSNATNTFVGANSWLQLRKVA